MLCNNWNCLIWDVESFFVCFVLCLYFSLSVTLGKTCHLCGARTSWECEGKAESAEILLFGTRVRLDSPLCLLAVFWVCIYPFWEWKHILLHNSETFVSVCDCYFLLQLWVETPWLYVMLSFKDLKDCHGCSDIPPCCFIVIISAQVHQTSEAHV